MTTEEEATPTESEEFPVPTVDDFDEEISAEERDFCIERYTDLNKIKQMRMHCTSCDKHMGLSVQNVDRLKMHPLLRTLMCTDCLEFYNSGEFLKGEDGSELYCRWCGQGGQVYCCASCIIVFCQNCIKRNYGASKIEDIESIDDWSCFVCNPKSLWCHRATLWAAKRYCDLKKKAILDLNLPPKREWQIDESTCCKRKQKSTTPKSTTPKSTTPKVKPASSADNAKKNTPASEKKAIKRALTPPAKIKKVTTTQPVATASPQTVLANLPSSISVKGPPAKKVAVGQIRIRGTYTPRPRKPKTFSPQTMGAFPSFTQLPPQGPQFTQLPQPGMQLPGAFTQMFNGFGGSPFGMQDCYSNIPHDNLNLSLESLTQGLDVNNMQNQDSHMDNNSLMCTPDLSLMIEPLCELNEDGDDDCSEVPPKDDEVECLTPRLIPKPLSALMEPPKVTRTFDMSPGNVIQMTDKDVTINKQTGGLKFRVDPATLSTNKMYQLPDGRIFAVNINPKMPGGYSATIVTRNDPLSLPPPQATIRPPRIRQIASQANSPILENTLSGRSRKSTTQTPAKSTSRKSTAALQKKKSTAKEREPVSKPDVSTQNGRSLRSRNSINKSNDGTMSSTEWFLYNLCDAIDVTSYVEKKLLRLKGNHPNLRQKCPTDIKDMHRTLDQLLKISIQRFTEVKTNLSLDYKGWLEENNSTDLLSDDDKEHISSPDTKKDSIEKSVNCVNKNSLDEPIFIDENSEDSFKPTHKADHSEINDIDSAPPTCELLDDTEPIKEAIDPKKSDEDANMSLKNDYLDNRRMSDDSMNFNSLDDTNAAEKSINNCENPFDTQNQIDDDTQNRIDEDAPSRMDDDMPSRIDDDAQIPIDDDTQNRIDESSNSNFDNEKCTGKNDLAADTENKSDENKDQMEVENGCADDKSLPMDQSDKINPILSEEDSNSNLVKNGDNDISKSTLTDVSDDSSSVLDKCKNGDDVVMEENSDKHEPMDAHSSSSIVE